MFSKTFFCIVFGILITFTRGIKGGGTENNKRNNEPLSTIVEYENLQESVRVAKILNDIHTGMLFIQNHWEHFSVGHQTVIHRFINSFEQLSQKYLKKSIGQVTVGDVIKRQLDYQPQIQKLHKILNQIVSAHELSHQVIPAHAAVAAQGVQRQIISLGVGSGRNEVGQVGPGRSGGYQGQKRLGDQVQGGQENKRQKG